MKISVLCMDFSVPFSEYEQYMKYISAERCEKIQRYRFDRKKTTSLLAEMLIRCKFSDRCEKIEFGYNENGKPYLKNYPQYHFSISHSDKYTVFAEHSEPIGVDIEKIKDNSKIARRFFTSYEADIIENSAERDKIFIKIWTSKEAYVKMLGTGFSAMPFNTFNVFDESLKCRFISKQFGEYMITVCGNNIGECIEIETLSVDFIIRSIIDGNGGAI